MSLKDEIYEHLLNVAKARARIPLEVARALDIPTTPVGISKAFFGLPIIVPGHDPIYRGQYVTHTVYASPDGDEVWVIRTGIFSIMAVFVAEGRKYYYPFAENGFLTAMAPTVLEWIERGEDPYGRRFAGYFEAVGNFRHGYVECKRSDILYIDQITQGKLPVVIVDKYKILRTTPPSEFVEEYAAAQYTIRELLKQKVEYERTIRNLRLVVTTREAEFVALKEDLEGLKNTVTTLLRENERLRTELMTRDIRERLRATGIERYERITEALERLTSDLTDLLDRISTLRERVEKITPAPQVVAPPPKEEKAPAPTPTPAGEERKYIKAGE